MDKKKQITIFKTKDRNETHLFVLIINPLNIHGKNLNTIEERKVVIVNRLLKISKKTRDSSDHSSFVILLGGEL